MIPVKNVKEIRLRLVPQPNGMTVTKNVYQIVRLEVVIHRIFVEIALSTAMSSVIPTLNLVLLLMVIPDPKIVT